MGRRGKADRETQAQAEEKRKALAALRQLKTPQGAVLKKKKYIEHLASSRQTVTRTVKSRGKSNAHEKIRADARREMDAPKR